MCNLESLGGRSWVLCSSVIISKMVREFWRVDLDSWMGKDWRREAEAATDARMESLHNAGYSPGLSRRSELMAPRRGPGNHNIH